MTRRPDPDDAILSVDALKRIDRLCRGFESAWKTGVPPRMEEYLGGARGDEREKLLGELLLLDLDYRQTRGEEPSREEYRERFPQDAQLIAEVFEGRFARAGEPPPRPQSAASPPTPISDPTLPFESAAPGTLSGEGAPTPQGAESPEGGPARLPLRRFGDYELLGEIGRGGMGVVSKARQVSLNRVVAVKMISAGQLAGEAEVGRFRCEAEAAARLDHPNIIAVYEVGEHRGQHFYSMQYVEGESLHQRVREGPLPAKRAARYVKQIAEAVAHAHQSGVLHRDLKPSNVLIDSADQARVTDFGLAKHVEGKSDLTLSGQVLGTPSYMSPEQAGAKRGKIGPASDVYSMGAILYELLTGRPPFRGATPVETLLQVRETDPPLPRALNPQVPRDLEMICLKCLEKDPRHRYPSARALAEDLDRYLHGDSISISSLSLFDRLIRTLERGHHDVEFRAWARMLFHFAWIVFVAHLSTFLLTRNGPPYPLAWLAAARAGEIAGMGLVLWLCRHDWFPPKGGPSRQLWALWLAYLAGSGVLALIGIRLAPPGQDFDVLTLYPQLAVLAGLGFFMMGGSYWGYCYLMGAAFLVLALLMPLCLSWAPLVFGAAWGASLAALGRHLRKLAEEP